MSRSLSASPKGKPNLLGFELIVILAPSISAVLVILFLRIPASNDRDWQPDVAFTPSAEIDGDIVTINGVRNFDYRSESDFTTRWEKRTYDLRKLDSADIIAVYWTGKAIAHIMVSFGFAGKDYLTVSIETRKEKARAIRPSPVFFVITSSIMSSPMSATSFGCEPPIANRRRMCISTGSTDPWKIFGAVFSIT